MEQMKSKKTTIFCINLIFLALVLVVFSLPFISYAQDYVPLESIGIDQPSSSNGNIDFTSYITGWVQILLWVAGILAVIVIIIGGLQYITAGDSESRTADAKDRIWKALIGLVIAVASWLILFTINPNILDTTLNIQEAPAQSTPPAPPPNVPDSSFFFCYSTSASCQEYQENFEEAGCDITSECYFFTSSPSNEGQNNWSPSSQHCFSYNLFSCNN